jgi:hypothetical protein
MQARGSIWRCLRKPEVTGNELRVAGNWWREKGERDSIFALDFLQK